MNRYIDVERICIDQKLRNIQEWNIVEQMKAQIGKISVEKEKPVKTCLNCHITKDRAHCFLKVVGAKDGWSGFCRKCINKVINQTERRLRARDDPEYQYRFQKAWRTRHPLRWKDINAKSRKRQRARMSAEERSAKDRKNNRKTVMNLYPCYVKRMIKTKYGIAEEDISDEMIEREREIIRINRLIRKEKENDSAKSINRG